MPLSKIKTNSLATGAITSAVMPTGSVLQVQHLQYTSTTSTAVNTQTNVSLDHLAVNITPISTSSIIRIDAAVTGEWENVAPNWNSNWFFYRDSTKLAAPTAIKIAITIQEATDEIIA